MTDTIDNLLDTVICGDVCGKLPEIPTGSVHCVVTSPPYWGLRDYGVAGQLGLEKTPEEYIAKMVAVFREVWRVLRDDGTLWLNMGDSYASGGRGGGQEGPAGEKQRSNQGALLGAKTPPPGLKPKDLCGIPWRLAFALQADGWYLRQDVIEEVEFYCPCGCGYILEERIWRYSQDRELIWKKPNPMPESVTDRCTKAHEYIFLMTKSGNPLTWTNNKLGISTRVSLLGIRGAEGVDWEWVEHSACEGEGCGNKRCVNGKVKTSLWQGHDYYYDAEAIREGNTEGTLTRLASGPVNNTWGNPKQKQLGRKAGAEKYTEAAGRNKRSVWTVATSPYKEAHFATFPPKLIEPCILAGCPEWVCKKCGEPRRRIVESELSFQSGSGKSGNEIIGKNGPGLQGGGETGDIRKGPCRSSTTTGWTDCGCNAGFDGGIVLDPFSGSGTVPAVAYENNRHYIGIELNPDRKIQKRIQDVHDKYALLDLPKGGEG